MKDRIAKSVFWMGWSKGVVQICAFISTVLVARLLEPSDFGLIALTGIWIGSLTLLAEMGLGATILQFRELDDRELNSCFWVMLSASLVGCGLLYAIAPMIAWWFGTPMLTEVLRVLSLTLPLTGLRTVPDSLLRKSLTLDKVSQAEILATLVALPVQVGLALLGAGVWALVAGILTTHVLQVVATFSFVEWRPGLRLGSNRLRHMVDYSLAALGGRVCWGVYDQIDIFILAKMSGDVVLGLYSMAKQIALLPVHKVSVVVNQLAVPVMAELQHDTEQMRLAFLRQMRWVACLTIPLCVGLALVADDFVHVALTDKWMPAVPLLQILCLFSMWHSLTVLMPPILLARYRAGFLFWWNASLLLTMPFVFWAGAVWNGALGLTLAWVTAYPLITIVKVRTAMKELDLSWTMIGSELRPIVAATVMMCCAVSIIQYGMPSSNIFEEILRLASSCLVGVFTYVAGIIWQGRLLVSEFAEVFGWLLRGFRPAPAMK